MPPLMGPESAMYDAQVSLEAERFFEDIFGIEPDREQVDAWRERIGTPRRADPSAPQTQGHRVRRIRTEQAH